MVTPSLEFHQLQNDSTFRYFQNSVAQIVKKSFFTKLENPPRNVSFEPKLAVMKKTFLLKMVAKIQNEKTFWEYFFVMFPISL